MRLRTTRPLASASCSTPSASPRGSASSSPVHRRTTLPATGVPGAVVPTRSAVFDAEQLQDREPTTFAASTAGALGVGVDALLGLEDASAHTGDSEGALLVALWPATVGYFLEQLLQPIVDDPTIEGVRHLFVGALRGLGPLPALRIGAQPYGVLRSPPSRGGSRRRAKARSR